MSLIAAAVLTIAQAALAPAGWSLSIFTDLSFYVSLVIFAIGTVLAFKKKHPILIICISAVLGIIWGYIGI